MSDPIRFLVLSSPRCGTHMLRTSLDNHPDVICMTEMFNPDYTEEKYEFTPDTPALEILSHYIYGAEETKRMSVGFLLHRVGARFGNWPDLWEILESDKDLFVISLRRKNLLRRYLSFQLRKNQDLEGNSPEPMAFDRDLLIKDFRRQERKIAEFDQRFNDHPLTIVTYEDLCLHYGDTMNRLQEFLQVRQVNLEPRTAKRATPVLSQIVTNYDDLKSGFENTEWHEFFDD